MSYNEKLNEIFKELNNSTKAEGLISDATNVTLMLKAAQVVAKEVMGEPSFNDIVTVYSLLKSESIARITEEMLQAGKRPPSSSIELIPMGNLLGGGSNSGLS